MPTDLTREKIERLRVDFDRGHDLGYGDQRALLAHALAEPARLAAARAEGVREGIETIITIAESDQRWRPGSLWDVLQREVAGRALSPAPAEPPKAPTTPTVEASSEERVAVWVRRCFGDAAMSIHERASRLMEEAIEMAQAAGVAREVANRSVAYIYGRRRGRRCRNSAASC